MTIAPGTRLGPYEIVSRMGAGGMGEVFRAKDTRLDRGVAIKVLPSHLSSNPQFRERFDREARAVSALNHPNICTLHDVGHQDGIDYIVMELLEGETLADRLSKGPLPLDQVMRYGVQLADGLDKAHRQGIVHRDLKPGNIMITKGGAKLLDFGLAKSVVPLAAVSGATNLATEHKPLTQEGTILGTFQYMAPEQLEGTEADVRTDIFALGVVLYEMVTGRRAFEGKTRTSLIAAIVDRDPPPITSLQPMSPPALEHVINRCLEKDPDDRWQSAHDVAKELTWIGDTGSRAGVAAPVIVRRKRRELVAWALAATCAAAAIALGAMAFRSREKSAEVLHVSVLAPKQVEFAFGSGPMAFAPDGKRMAFIAHTPSGEDALWIRLLRAESSQLLAGTEGASYPFWSPDSRFIGFFAAGKLKRIDANGGPPQMICEASSGRGGTWNRDNVILFALVRDALYEVAASGGQPKKVSEFDPQKGEADHRWPIFLPDGKHYLFLARAEDPEESVIWAGKLGSKERQKITQASSNFDFAEGRLLFVREKTLLAQELDARSRTLEGDPTPIAEQLTYISGTASAVFSVSQNGLLGYVQGSAKSELVWYDRNGKDLGRIGAPAAYGSPRISPDDKRVAVDVASPGGKFDIWIYEVSRAAATRFTFKPFDELSPVWSSDGEHLAYSIRPHPPAYDVVLKPARGAGLEQTIWQEPDSLRFPADWSRDGKMLLVSLHNPKRKVINDVWIYSLVERKARPVIQSPFTEGSPSFSPDARWLVYSSNEAGRSEVYAQPIAGGGKWQISTAGGGVARWSKKGDEIFYLTLDRQLMSVPVKTGTSLEVGDPRLLFKTNAFLAPGAEPFDVSSDGQRFLINALGEETANVPITLVSNWRELVAPR